MKNPWRVLPVLAALAAAWTANSFGADVERPAAVPPTASLDGTITLSGKVIAAGVGYNWGRGTLKYQGQEVPFCIRGLSVGDVGAVELKAQGSVFNLKTLDDFSGKYFQVSTGATIARGATTALLKNKHGVMMQLELEELGVRFNIAASGMNVILGNQRGCTAS
ncbi:MAG TPA: hypothetical protein VHB68_19175 [Steroidobacteraceae bacterium]|nr:hypothetical protein [Steroidobacteraceae bacterium]